jgi:putative DNA primase/helicase
MLQPPVPAEKLTGAEKEIPDMKDNDIYTGDATGEKMPQDVLEFLNRLGRGGKWQYYVDFKDKSGGGGIKHKTTFEVGEPTKLPDWKAVYYPVHPLKEKPGKNERGVAANVEAINALFAEYDQKDSWTLEKILERVASLPPSLVIFSGGGWHLYWLLKDTIKVTHENRLWLKDIQHAWVEYWDSDDNAKDLARVLRVPGSFNNKYSEPIQVVFVRADYDLEYEFSELYEIVRPLVEEKKKNRASRKQRALQSMADARTRELVTIALDFISTEKRLDKREDWFNFIAALHHTYGGTDEGLRIAHEVSRRSANYGGVDDVWDSLDRDRHDGWTAGSIIYWADEDSNGEFSRLHRQPGLTAESFTDTGNADRLEHLYGDQLRYNKSLGWVAWDGKKWEIDASHLAIKYAKATARSLFDDAKNITDDDLRKRVATWASRSLNLNKLDGMLGAAKDNLHTSTETFEDNNKWLFNVDNGVLDLKTGLLLSHDPKYMMTRIAGTHYDPTADAPKWGAFVEMIFPDAEVRKYVQKAVGYSLTGNSDERAIYFLEGANGENGKSTFISALLEMFGEYGKVTDISVITGTGQKSLTPLNEDFHNRRFVATNELPANLVWNTTIFKSLSGNDRIHTNPKNRKPYDFPPSHHLWIFGNNRPSPDNPDDEAFWKRMKRIVFEKEIPADIRRPGSEVLAEFREELPGILNWAVEGLHLYLKEGWQIPQVLMDAVKEYKSEHDYLAQFIEEYGYLVTGNEKDLSIRKGDFVSMYNNFRKLYDVPELSPTKVTKDLKKLGVEAGGNGKAFYRGIRSKTPNELKMEMEQSAPISPEPPPLNPHANDHMDDEEEEEDETFTIIDCVAYRHGENGKMIEVEGQEAQVILARVGCNAHQ